MIKGEILSIISTTVITGGVDDVVELTWRALDEGLTSQEILNNGLMPGINHIGLEFKAGRVFVPEVLRAARTMQTSMDILKPLLIETEAKRIGTVLLGTVKGDIHDIGKNLVGIMCEGAGFEVRDLGINVSPETFVKAVKQFNPDVVGVSALLTTTMHVMGYIIKALEEARIRDTVKVMVGGTPVTQAFASQIGADGYASNAAEAAELVKKLVG